LDDEDPGYEIITERTWPDYFEVSNFILCALERLPLLLIRGLKSIFSECRNLVNMTRS